MAIDFTSWTTYLQGALAAVLAWIVKSVIELGKNQVKLQTVVEYYVERQTRDAAIRLETVSNPTPLWAQELLQKYRHGTLGDDERQRLVAWMKTLPDDPTADAAERSAALQMLTGIQTLGRLKQRRRWWQLT